MPQLAPLLSVVATSRNDDHGGNLLARMQYFVDGFIAQCKRHNLPAELILVEWNPPAGRPPLAEALAWPRDAGPVEVRIITVPHEVHAQFKHAASLPLYQMIAKNAGIRRARGEFVLATNIDILFSDAIFAFMRNKLQRGHLYRADRCDVPPQLPKGGIVDWLAYCDRAYFRINAKGQTLVKQNGKWRPIRDPAHLPFLARMARRIASLVLLPYRHSPEDLIAKLRRRLLRLWRLLADPVRTSGDAKRQAWRLVDRLVRLIRPLHTNGCGDFTLMAAADWSRLRGYPEWDMFSWHVDSVLLYQANAMGIKEIDLPSRIFHIEHGHGSGYTPEGAGDLFSRLRAAGIPYLEYKDFLELIADMPKTRRQGRPVLYNSNDWGMANAVLAEVRPAAPVLASTRSGASS